MFYCQRCATRHKWPESFSQSYGPCEMCGKVAVCNDVPSSWLPDPEDDDDEQDEAA
jgi:hypothetical protein